MPAWLRDAAGAVAKRGGKIALFNSSTKTAISKNDMPPTTMRRRCWRLIKVEQWTFGGAVAKR